MKKFSSIFSTIFILAIALSSPSFATTKEKWNSVDGLKRLDRSQSNSDFYQLVNFYQPQANPLYCSIATGTILLNATRNRSEIANQKENQVILPESIGGGVAEFHSYSQLSFLNNRTDAIKKREIIQLKAASGKRDGEDLFDAGLSLADFSKIMTQVYEFKVSQNHVEKNNAENLAKFRDDLKKYLADDKNFVVVNFDGKIVGNGTRGHFSPLAAYDKKSDSVLILDVALHKTDWYWIDLLTLFEAMNTKDGDTYRGYLIISKQ